MTVNTRIQYKNNKLISIDKMLLKSIETFSKCIDV